MQITLCEDDGIFFDGVPRNVILLVKFDDGKQIRVPYSAEKPISAMYEDLQRIAPQATEMTYQHNEVSEVPKEIVLPKPVSSVTVGIPIVDKSHVIEKEDIVTLIKLEDRGEGASVDLTVGREYRVIKVISTGVTLPGSDNITQIVNGYDVVDDKSARPERTRVFPHEVQLARKRTPPQPVSKGKVEEILPCPNCNNNNSLYLEGSAFIGTCEACKSDIKIERIIKKCTTDKCNNDVSLFDTGDKYKGKCNKCSSQMEIPYA